jgi:hypothetical protein
MMKELLLSVIFLRTISQMQEMSQMTPWKPERLKKSCQKNSKIIQAMLLGITFTPKYRIVQLIYESEARKRIKRRWLEKNSLLAKLFGVIYKGTRPNRTTGQFVWSTMTRTDVPTQITKQIKTNKNHSAVLTYIQSEMNSRRWLWHCRRVG